ncbi:hypothetical protein, partial [Nonomuraea sp. NEAU-A123]|uniref:hypothetical protein n=1 Tax=Nonomuraea sp. NEAU-A123 TaxID=2839649 RepID=UPI001BE3F10D
LTPAELVTSNELIASTDFDFAVPAEVVASAFGSEPRLDVTDPRLVTGVSRSILERLKPLEPIADLLARASAPLPEATTEFDAFTPVSGAATTRFDAFAPAARRDGMPATRRDSTPHRPRPRTASQHTPYRRATELWPTAEQAESPQTGGYYGRRRRSGHPVEESAPFASDGPLRGRRHRPLGAAHGAEAFAQDAPSQGRRHRLPSAVPPRTEPFDTAARARRQHSHEAPAAPHTVDELRAWYDEPRTGDGDLRAGDGDLLVAPRTQAFAPVHPQPRTTHGGSRRGRHRA